jgi:hypothetical protein
LVPFDHSALDAILKIAVKDRLVDYGAVAKKRPQLDAYLARVAAAKASALGGPDDQLAFYVNAYNARVLRSVLVHGLDQSHGKVVDVKGFFDGEQETVAGEPLTLNELEEKKIRRLDAAPGAKGISADPRVHFIVNCASKDCPPLAAHAYTAASLKTDLDERPRAYLTRPGECAVDDKQHRIVVVQIFEWYASDFAGEAGVRRFIAGYVPALKDKLLDDKWDLDYRPYDWSPNAA